MFRTFKLTPTLGALALFFFGTNPALAQSAPAGANQPVARTDVPVTARMGIHVSALVLEDLKQFVTDDEKLAAMFLRMAILAKQEAIGVNCAAYEIDKERMVALMMQTMRPLSEGVEKDVATAHLTRALRQYNTLLGGELAVFADDRAGYCAAGKTLFAELGENSEADSMLALKPAG
ncbi:MAG: hypothetical protein ACK4RT_06225 [Erythrobacter sp.]